MAVTAGSFYMSSGLRELFYPFESSDLTLRSSHGDGASHLLIIQNTLTAQNKCTPTKSNSLLLVDMFSVFLTCVLLNNVTASGNQIFNQNWLSTWRLNMQIFDYVIELLPFPREKQLAWSERGLNDSLCDASFNTDHSHVDTTLPPCGWFSY